MMSSASSTAARWLRPTCLLARSSVLVLVFLLASVARPATLIVPDQYPSITAAIAASIPGDSVLIRPGIYFERLAVGHDLTLMGLGPGTIVDGEFKTAASLVHIVNGARVQLVELALRYGSSPQAGAIKAEPGTELWLTRVAVEGNGTSCIKGGYGTGGVVADRLFASECRFTGNSGGSSGALSFGTGEVKDCIFAHNFSSGHPICGGGPAVLAGGDCLFERCQFESNWGDGPQALLGYGRTTLRDSEFTDHRIHITASSIVHFMLPSTVERCRFTEIENGGRPIIESSDSLDLLETVFDNNVGLGTIVQSLGVVRMAGCLMARSPNHLGLEALSATTESCTFADLRVGVLGSNRLTVKRSIFTNIRGAAAINCNADIKNDVDCNDLWGNDLDYLGCEPGLHDIAADPLFCTPAAGDYRLNANSPCAPLHSPPECGLIGAFGVGCGAIAINESAPPEPEPRFAIRPNPVWLEAEFVVQGVRTGSLVDLFNASGRLIDTLDPDPTGVVRWRPPPRAALGRVLRRGARTRRRARPFRAYPLTAFGTAKQRVEASRKGLGGRSQPGRRRGRSGGSPSPPFRRRHRLNLGAAAFGGNAGVSRAATRGSGSVRGGAAQMALP